MCFESILFRDGRPVDSIERQRKPAFFGDLNLDPIIERMLAGRDEYRLACYCHAPLDDAASIRYRLDALRELERAEIAAAVAAFARTMRAVREDRETARRMPSRWQQHRYVLDAARHYGAAVTALLAAIRQHVPASEAFGRLRDWLETYTRGDAFRRLVAEADEIGERLDAVRYSVHLRGHRVTVCNEADGNDYGREVAEVFARFREIDLTDTRSVPREHEHEPPDMNHVEATILGYVAELNPDVFDALDRFATTQADFVDVTVARFDREVQLLVAYLAYIERLRATGLPFCYPELTTESKCIMSRRGFDLALADKLAAEGRQPVPNDFHLDGDERILVVTGPNRGGKTTFARMVGQLHYLAAMGWLVPGEAARLFLCDRIFTHFERREGMQTLRGKLHDDLSRIRAILDGATARSLVIMNEMFGSTSLRDALFLSREIIGRLIGIDALCVYVTFIEELSTLGPQTVSLLGEVEDAVTGRCTFRIVRGQADGRAYARTLACRYGLTYAQLHGRIRA